MNRGISGENENAQSSKLARGIWTRALSITSPTFYCILFVLQSSASRDVSLHVLCVVFSRQLAEMSPYMEAMRKQDVEVLFCYEPYDELVLMNLAQFDRKNLKSIENEVTNEAPADSKPETVIEEESGEFTGSSCQGQLCNLKYWALIFLCIWETTDYLCCPASIASYRMETFVRHLPLS